MAADRTNCTGSQYHGALSPANVKPPSYIKVGWSVICRSYVSDLQSNLEFIHHISRCMEVTEPPKQVAQILHGHSGRTYPSMSYFLDAANDTTTQNKNASTFFKFFHKNFQFVFFIDTQTVLCKFEHEEIIVY